MKTNKLRLFLKNKSNGELLNLLSKGQNEEIEVDPDYLQAIIETLEERDLKDFESKEFEKLLNAFYAGSEFENRISIESASDVDNAVNKYPYLEIESSRQFVSENKFTNGHPVGIVVENSNISIPVKNEPKCAKCDKTSVGAYYETKYKVFSIQSSKSTYPSHEITTSSKLFISEGFCQEFICKKCVSLERKTKRSNVHTGFILIVLAVLSFGLKDFMAGWFASWIFQSY